MRTPIAIRMICPFKRAIFHLRMYLPICAPAYLSLLNLSYATLAGSVVRRLTFTTEVSKTGPKLLRGVVSQASRDLARGLRLVVVALVDAVLHDLLVSSRQLPGRFRFGVAQHP